MVFGDLWLGCRTEAWNDVDGFRKVSLVLLLLSVLGDIDSKELFHLKVLDVVHIKRELKVIIVHGHGISQRSLVILLINLKDLHLNLIRTIIHVRNPFVVGNILFKVWNLKVKLLWSSLGDLITILIIGIKVESELRSSDYLVL